MYKVIHGKSRTLEYRSWRQMNYRCYYETCHAFPEYGGRGIRVCAAWQASIDNFMADMGDRPSKRHTIDRKDVDGHYSCGHCHECIANGWPANCRWATRMEQAQNRRSSVLVTYRGETHCVSAWARKLGMNIHVVRRRLHDGKTVEEALDPRRMSWDGSFIG